MKVSIPKRTKSVERLIEMAGRSSTVSGVFYKFCGEFDCTDLSCGECVFYDKYNVNFTIDVLADVIILAEEGSVVELEVDDD